MQTQALNPVAQLEVYVAVIRAVIALVQEVETPGNGTAKKQAVLDLVAAIYDTNPNWQHIPRTTILAFASTVIDLVVAFFNLIGRFKRSTPTPGTPPAAPDEDRTPDRGRRDEP